MEMNKIAKYIVTGICVFGGMFIGCFGVFGMPADGERDECDEQYQDTAVNDGVNVLDGYDPFCLTEGDDYPAPEEFESYVNVKY